MVVFFFFGGTPFFRRGCLGGREIIVGVGVFFVEGSCGRQDFVTHFGNCSIVAHFDSFRISDGVVIAIKGIWASDRHASGGERGDSSGQELFVGIVVPVVPSGVVTYFGIFGISQQGPAIGISIIISELSRRWAFNRHAGGGYGRGGGSGQNLVFGVGVGRAFSISFFGIRNVASCRW